MSIFQYCRIYGQAGPIKKLKSYIHECMKRAMSELSGVGRTSSGAVLGRIENPNRLIFNVNKQYTGKYISYAYIFLFSLAIPTSSELQD